LRALAGELGLASQVIFAGFHSDPTPFYRTADLFVLSSDYEGFGNVIVEALACGTPVVSTDCPSGPAEIFENGLHGRLVPVRDAPALANAMREALSAPHDPAALKRRASDFAPSIAAKRYLELLCP
jgi:glycosyltransferase involved in cell wall biosynthesis